jgi:hypothetical protein
METSSIDKKIENLNLVVELLRENASLLLAHHQTNIEIGDLRGNAKLHEIDDVLRQVGEKLKIVGRTAISIQNLFETARILQADPHRNSERTAETIALAIDDAYKLAKAPRKSRATQDRIWAPWP